MEKFIELEKQNEMNQIRNSSQGELFELIIDILKNTADLRPKMVLGAIQPQSSWREDLGFDSLALMILFVELQNQFECLDPLVVARWETLQDCINSVNDLRQGQE